MTEEEAKENWRKIEQRLGEIALENVKLLSDWNKAHIETDTAQVAKNVEVIHDMAKLFLVEI